MKLNQDRLSGDSGHSFAGFLAKRAYNRQPIWKLNSLIAQLLNIAGILLVLATLPLLAELLVLTAASLLPSRGATEHDLESADFPIAVVIPAHNEEALIERCIRSIAASARAGDALMVVAHNCTDATAAKAEAAGARVLKLLLRQPRPSPPSHPCSYAQRPSTHRPLLLKRLCCECSVRSAPPHCALESQQRSENLPIPNRVLLRLSMAAERPPSEREAPPATAASPAPAESRRCSVTALSNDRPPNGLSVISSLCEKACE